MCDDATLRRILEKFSGIGGIKGKGQRGKGLKGPRCFFSALSLYPYARIHFYPSVALPFCPFRHAFQLPPGSLDLLDSQAKEGLEQEIGKGRISHPGALHPFGP